MRRSLPAARPVLVAGAALVVTFAFLVVLAFAAVRLLP
jgi:hypothetical protein